VVDVVVDIVVDVVVDVVVVERLVMISRVTLMIVH